MDDNNENDPLLVVTTGNHRDVTTGNHRDVTTGTHRDPGEVSHRPQYGRRHHIPSVDSDRDIAHPDYGTYLAQLRDSSEHLPPMDNPVTVALHRCNKRVLRPYKRLLLLVGWEPWFDDPTHCCQKVINILHPLLVLVFVLAGYVIQYAACFRRDSAGGHEPWRPKTNSSNYTMTGCESVLISQYLIPDVLHSLAYVYSFYLMRVSQSEQLPTLIERVFLQTSPTQSGFLSQGRLIRVMMLLLGLCVAWVLLSLSAQIIHVVAAYQEISFTWMSPGTTSGRIFFLILMLLSFVFLDVVYTAVVINYCVQCCLLVFYIEGLQQKLKRKLIELSTGIKEIAEIESHLRSLNYTTGIALSIVLFNFGTMAFLGAVRIFDKSNGFDAWMFVSTSLSVIFWFSIIALPIVQAARLSAACNSLRKVGHELRVKPFVYQDISDQDLDSFLLYTSSLNLRAKIFLVPVKTSYIAGVTVAVAFVFLLLFQTEVIRIWL